MAAYYGKSCVFDPRFLARKAKLDSINSISQNPHGWTSILGKLSVDPCFPLNNPSPLMNMTHWETGSSTTALAPEQVGFRSQYLAERSLTRNNCYVVYLKGKLISKVHYFALFQNQ